jgi:hypothetical protein
MFAGKSLSNNWEKIQLTINQESIGTDREIRRWKGEESEVNWAKVNVREVQVVVPKATPDQWVQIAEARLAARGLGVNVTVVRFKFRAPWSTPTFNETTGQFFLPDSAPGYVEC